MIITPNKFDYKNNKSIVLNDITLKIDKLNAKSLIDGYFKNNKKIRTSIFCAGKKSWSFMALERNPKLITLSTTDPPKVHPLSKIGSTTYDKNYKIDYKYVAVLDTTFEINNNYQLFWELCKDGTFDIWRPEAPFNMLEDKQKPDMILLLRVHILEEMLPYSSVKIGTRTDRIDGNRNVKISKPVIEDNEFNAIKNNLISKIKKNEEHFKILESQIKNFLKQSKTDNLQTKDYIKEIFGVELDLSFGIGGKAKITWMSFLLGENRTSNGIYPLLLYDHKESQLFLTYGVSETNVPKEKWKSELLENYTKISDSDIATPNLKEKYPNSYMPKNKKYLIPSDVDSFDVSALLKEIDLLIHNYKNMYEEDYTPSEFIREEDEYENLHDPVLDLLKNKKQVILYGPPGTGKTFKTKQYATEFLSRYAENILPDYSLGQNVWIIKIDPKGRFFDVIDAINDEELKEDVWPSDRYKGIKKGDIGLMCTLGQNAGIYAQINILSNPEMMLEPEASMKHWKSPDHKNTKIMRVKYNYKYKFTDNPILISDLLKIKGLENLEILTQPQDTNFKVKKEEWEIISKLIEERIK